MTSVSDIRKALLDELHRQLTDGFKTTNDEGEVITLSVPAAVLAVAAKVVKELNDTPNPSDTLVRKGQEVSDTLRRYQERKMGAQPSA